MNLRQITHPASLPVSLDEAKAYYRVLHDDEDMVITRTIQAAVAKAEQITNRQLSIATYELSVDGFADVRIPRPPLVSVDKVEYIDADQVRHPWTGYRVDQSAGDEPAQLIFTATPPGVGAVITFTSGYAADAMPAPIIQWILIYGLTMYEQRENMVIGVSVSDRPKAYYDHLLDSYRVIPI